VASRARLRGVETCRSGQSAAATVAWMRRVASRARLRGVETCRSGQSAARRRTAGSPRPKCSCAQCAVPVTRHKCTPAPRSVGRGARLHGEVEECARSARLRPFERPHSRRYTAVGTSRGVFSPSPPNIRQRRRKNTARSGDAAKSAQRAPSEGRMSQRDYPTTSLCLPLGSLIADDDADPEAMRLRISMSSSTWVGSFAGSSTPAAISSFFFRKVAFFR